MSNTLAHLLEVSYAFPQSKFPIGTQGDTDLLLRFRPLLPPRERRTLNLSLVIDRSGSMAGERLRHALNAAQAVIDQLDAKDTVSVVVFDDVVSTIIHPQHPLNKVELKQHIQAVRAGGTTNLSGGWLEGCKHVKAQYDPEKINRVLLLTDGQANEGITDKRLLIQTASDKAKEQIVTTTLGFGAHFEEDLLVGMARAAGGNFYFIQNKIDATEVFNMELQALKSVVAQHLRVTLTPQMPLDSAYIFTLSTLAEKESWFKTGIDMDLGPVFDGEDKRLGLTVTLPHLLQMGTLTLMTLRVSVEMTNDHGLVVLTGDFPITLPIVSIDEAASAATTGIQVEMAKLKIAHAKEVALHLSDQGQAAAAEQALQAVITHLKTQGLDEKFEIAEEMEQLLYFASRLGQSKVSNETRKELRDQSFQGLTRNRADLAGRGTEMAEEVLHLPITAEVGEGVVLSCVREGGKLRIRAQIQDSSTGLEAQWNVQFPRAMRAEGAKYVVEGLEPSADGSFYRVRGAIRRFVPVGEVDPINSRYTTRHATPKTGKASKAPATLADLEVTQQSDGGVLVQCLKDKSKLRVRVVSDGYEPTWNMRFPRSIREEGILYVVDEIITAPDGKSYIACGKIKRFEQT